MRSPRSVFVLALVLGLSFGGLPSSLTAQATTPAATTSEAASQPALTAPAAQSAPSLPVREQAPRTLRAHWHVFTAFAVAWLLLFGYALALGRRFARIERTLDAVRASQPAERRSTVASVG